ncbi:MAG: peptidoglycan synthetase [Bacteroidetes bacterium]|nr:peptidoglycan synthetase [Bacteroidota bacterium]
MVNSKKRIHFIAIGGSTMSSLAIALKQKGMHVSGSDDEIREPSKNGLEKHGLLPSKMGWDPDTINDEIDHIILGMHAQKDNPELLRAKKLGLKIYSYPEIIYDQCLDKERVVIAGSHGKTTITAIVLHVLKYCKIDFDYLIGAQVHGFDSLIKLSDSPVMIIEGDEYLSSPIDKKPKFLHYHHHIGLISGISWDHSNVYPDFDAYRKAFSSFVDSTPRAGLIIYNQNDKYAKGLCEEQPEDRLYIGYSAHKYKIVDGVTFLETENFGEIHVSVFGLHNMENISAAKLICHRIGISEEKFYEEVKSFKGAFNRMELLAESPHTSVYKDFAHAPSKVKATTIALKKQFPKRELVACLELHTYSSLNKDFLKEYKNVFDSVDLPVIYFNPKTLEHKKMEPLNNEDIKSAFNLKGAMIFTETHLLKEYLQEQNWENKNLLLMSSGNFDGMDLEELAKTITQGA